MQHRAPMHPLLAAFSDHIATMSLAPGWRTSAAPRRLTIEVIRFRGSGAKLLVSATFAPGTRVEPDAGFARRTIADGVDELTRDREQVLVTTTADRVELERSITGDAIAPDDARRSLADVPELGVFAALAHGTAVLTQWGLGVDGDRRLGLVSIHRDLDRGTLDEAHLHAAGFREVEEGLWSTAGSALSLVWMGGTVYGYLGPINQRVMGSWFTDAATRGDDLDDLGDDDFGDDDLDDDDLDDDLEGHDGADRDGAERDDETT